MNHQHLIATTHQHNDRRGQLWPDFFATFRTSFRDIRVFLHRTTTHPTELGVEVPIENLLAFTRHEIDVAR